MGILPCFVAGLANLAVVAIDVAVLLLLVRALVRRWPNKFLAAVDKAGTPVVDLLCDMARQAWARLGNARPLTSGGKLAVAVVLLLAVRTVIVLVTVLVR